jgi:hydrogenase expression/formation protein HypE
MTSFPLGKLPFEYLAGLLARAPLSDPRVVQGPGSGLDCAVIDLGDRYLVFKSDPITFATDQIGWYAVQVNANDIATTGGEPRWMLATLLLPEGKADALLVEGIFDQLTVACRELGISLVGGHTEVTYGLDRPVISAALVGEVERGHLIMPGGARPGNRLLLTKGVPVEAVSVLAREFPDRLRSALSEVELAEACDYLYRPGISVVRDARIAVRAGRVTAMHDPTEGGLASALWELAEACKTSLVVDPMAVPVPPLARRICDLLKIDPMASIASGALLLACEAQDSPSIIRALEAEGIACAEIGRVDAGLPTVRLPAGGEMPRPERDEIARLFEGEPE